MKYRRQRWKQWRGKKTSILEKLGAPHQLLSMRFHSTTGCHREDCPSTDTIQNTSWEKKIRAEMKGLEKKKGEFQSTEQKKKKKKFHPWRKDLKCGTLEFGAILKEALRPHLLMQDNTYQEMIQHCLYKSHKCREGESLQHLLCKSIQCKSTLGCLRGCSNIMLFLCPKSWDTALRNGEV